MTIIEQSYSGRLVMARLGILAAGLFVVGTNAFVIAGLLPQIADGLGTSVSRVSYSITLYAIIVAVASPVLSIVLARMDRSRLMALGLATIAVGTAITAASPTIDVFDAGRMLAALGGAALVPAATAAAPALLPPEQRGRALAIAGLGFTLATAIGSPLGTALAGPGGWRLPLVVLAALGAALAVVVAVVVRDVPLGRVSGARERLTVLRSGTMLLTLGAALLLTTSFNIVYIFSAAVTAKATTGSSTGLAILLLLFGLGGVVGTNLSGRLTDRLGSCLMVIIGLAGEAVVLALTPAIASSYAALAVAFFVWGAFAFAVVVPVQHRLVSIDPAAAGIALSWYSTAMYLGISAAPLLGAVALRGAGALGGGALVPLTGGGLAVLALAVFLLGYRRRARVVPSLRKDSLRQRI